MEAATQTASPEGAQGTQNAYDELLAKLNESQTPTVEGFGDLEGRVETVRAQVGEKLKWFCNEAIELTHAGIEVFTGEPHKTLAGEKFISARMDADEGSLFACTLLPVDGFRYLLTAALVGLENPIDPPAKDDLSPAERKMFLRLVDTLCTGYFDALDTDNEAEIPRQPIALEAEDLAQLASGDTIVSLAFEVVILEQRFVLQILTPMNILQPEDGDVADDDQYERSAGELNWKRDLMLTLENVQIPLHAQLASADLPLSVVDAFKPGQVLDLDVNTSGLRILEEGGATAFLADLQISLPDMSLRVSGQSKVEGI